PRSWTSSPRTTSITSCSCSAQNPNSDPSPVRATLGSLLESPSSVPCATSSSPMWTPTWIGPDASTGMASSTCGRCGGTGGSPRATCGPWNRPSSGFRTGASGAPTRAIDTGTRNTCDTRSDTPTSGPCSTLGDTGGSRSGSVSGGFAQNEKYLATVARTVARERSDGLGHRIGPNTREHDHGGRDLRRGPDGHAPRRPPGRTASNPRRSGLGVRDRDAMLPPLAGKPTRGGRRRGTREPAKSGRNLRPGELPRRHRGCGPPIPDRIHRQRCGLRSVRAPDASRGLHRGGPADPETGRPAGPDDPEHGIDRPHVPPAPPPRTGEGGPVPVGRAATIPPSGILRPV